jgi:hypothetical protein
MSRGLVRAIAVLLVLSIVAPIVTAVVMIVDWQSTPLAQYRAEQVHEEVYIAAGALLTGAFLAVAAVLAYVTKLHRQEPVGD